LITWGLFSNRVIFLQIYLLRVGFHVFSRLITPDWESVDR
jgi:hypothetical protein